MISNNNNFFYSSSPPDMFTGAMATPIVGDINKLRLANAFNATNVFFKGRFSTGAAEIIKCLIVNGLNTLKEHKMLWGFSPSMYSDKLRDNCFYDMIVPVYNEHVVVGKYRLIANCLGKEGYKVVAAALKKFMSQRQLTKL